MVSYRRSADACFHTRILYLFTRVITGRKLAVTRHDLYPHSTIIITQESYEQDDIQ